jgi:dTDP-4-dehydrorhamnose reductase
MSWLLFGGSGQLGRSFQEYLKQNQIEFMAPSSNSLNLISYDSIERYIRLNKPEVVVNCAAWTDVSAAEKHERNVFALNALAPKNIAFAAKKIGAQFVQISTDYVFSGHRAVPWEEDSLVNPVSVYGKSKALGEKLVLETYPENSFIIRTAWLYSKYGNNFAKKICRIAEIEDKNIDVVDDQIGQPTFTGDLVRQIHLTSKFGLQPGIYHGTNSGETSWFGFAKKIFEILGKDTNRLRRINSQEYPTSVERPAYSVLGHNSWLAAGVSLLPNWEISLTNSMAEIFSEVNVEQ